MGLPPAGEEDDGFNELFAHEPEGSVGEEEEVEGMHGKDKISWSYSNYMNALEKEDILNNTDETTFSSLMSDNASETKELAEDDKESITSKKSASQSSLNKKEMRSDHTQTENRKTTRFAEPENKGKRKGKDGRKLSLAPLEEEALEEELPTKPPPKKSIKTKSHSPQLLQKRWL